MIHARIQKFLRGRGVQVHLAYKKSSDNVFSLICLVLKLFYRSSVATFKEKVPGGGGVQLFTGGPIAFSL